MASLGHLAVGVAAARVYRREQPSQRAPLASLLLWSALSFLPDADVTSHSMRLIVASLRVLMLGLVMCAGADVGTADAQGLGYGIVGPAGFSGFFGSSASAVHASGGGEVLVGGRGGAAAELGVLGNSSSALVVFSANGVLHFSTGRGRRGSSPYVTSGYTHMASGEGSFSAWNVGGGIDVWMQDRIGLRVEFRDHVRPDFRGTVQYWTIRAGVCFR
jgi:hypothetical protein